MTAAGRGISATATSASLELARANRTHRSGAATGGRRAGWQQASLPAGTRQAVRLAGDGFGATSHAFEVARRSNDTGAPPTTTRVQALPWPIAYLTVG
jgi:hypothetical protein